jgi:hypothetical protein
MTFQDDSVFIANLRVGGGVNLVTVESEEIIFNDSAIRILANNDLALIGSNSVDITGAGIQEFSSDTLITTDDPYADGFFNTTTAGINFGAGSDASAKVTNSTSIVAFKDEITFVTQGDPVNGTIAVLNLFETIGDIDNRINAIGTGSLTDIINNITILQGNVTDLETDVGVLQGNVTDLETDVGVLQGNVTDLETDVGVLQGNVTDLETDVGVLQGNVTDLETDVGVLQGNVTDLETDVGVLQGNVTDLETDVGVLQGNVTDLETDVGVL